MKLQDVLEKFKQQGNYDVSLYYGESVGCDDLSILPQHEEYSENGVYVWVQKAQ
ncbi:hypothetical protein B4092_4845 [Bacillus licheniformis]|uniref:hypothetical protein n=1 Tax=Bacillota TaxID=1239 RepID=UPI00079C3EE0|nr:MULTISPECIES: hypothetical protein [Bacillota]KYC77108.1 hypothetical protein B4092_4845 [Bacillus licheniformis]TWM14798.1 hypothetical protein CHCC15091_1839 [Bacillus licheniformis]TWN76545.1 hypothetical protein CHCC20494_0608 [Bacillus licheniformis]GIN25450.1 hypothetical protein J31TS2_20300 [Bacillus licheniformis]GIN29811.1 hypothetical protein J2TS5_18500 [Bacillus licheniformis]